MSENLDKFQQKQLLAYAKDLAVIYEKEKEKKAKLELANKKLRATIDSVSEGILAIDENDIIIEANMSFSQISGMSLEELVGKPLRDCLSNEGWEELLKSVGQIENKQDILINPDKKNNNFSK